MLYSVEKYRRGAHLPFPGLQPVEKWATNLYCSVNTGTCVCELVFCTGPACCHSQSHNYTPAHTQPSAVFTVRVSVHVILVCSVMKHHDVESGALVKIKVAHTRSSSVGFRSWSRFLAVSLQVTWVINPAVGCHYFPPGLLPMLGEQRHNGCEQSAYPTMSWLRLPGPSAPESSTLTTWLLSHPVVWLSRPIAATCNGIAAMPRDRQ